MTPADRLNRAAGLLGLEQRIPEETGTVQWVDTWTAIVLALAEQVTAKRPTLHLPKDK